VLEALFGELSPPSMKMYISEKTAKTLESHQFDEELLNYTKGL